ncbi:hypothetical protein GCM10009665_42910 [Kitasatospora nipponensis]|uniref:DNA-binding protein n=1 Tax=Kitasatospora nipponensis TaxID=258049 RepID=A0ABN1WDW0_9ACTN
MDDQNQTQLSRADQVRLYLATLQARMDPDQFRVLGRLVTGAITLLTSPSDELGIDISDEDEVFLTREVKDELLAILGILATGRMDQQVIDLGDGATSIMDPQAAADPVKVQELREWTAEQRRLRRETDTVLRGIADASQA